MFSQIFNFRKKNQIGLMKNRDCELVKPCGEPLNSAVLKGVENSVGIIPILKLYYQGAQKVLI